MKIAVDVVSGENNPETLIKGALSSLSNKEIEVILVGDESLIHKELDKLSPPADRCSVTHAGEIIEMDESPASACRKKKDASIMVASRLVAEKVADGFFSPGNTGATLTSSLINIKRVPGVSRPALAVILPSAKGHTLLLDGGANVDCSAENLAQFAIMGEIFVMNVLDVEKPKVGLLSIGEEDKKGNELSLKAFEIIKQTDVNFVGNVEGHDVTNGELDVIVCDGFIGNICLKLLEGLGSVILGMIKEEMTSSFINKIGSLFMKNPLRNVKERFNPEAYGGAPLLGISGCAIVGHGSSGERAVMNGIFTSAKMAKTNMNSQIEERIKQLTGVTAGV